MAHPHNELRQHKVERKRVAHITKGYAAGGAVETVAAPKAKAKGGAVKKTAMRMTGGAVKHRADKRARGGKVKHKGTTVNIINSPQHPGMPPMPPPGLAGAMPPRPPMAPPPMMPPGGAAPPMPPPGAMPPGMPPRPGMMPPPSMPMRARGGRIKDGPTWNEGLNNGTQVQHRDGKSDGKNIGRGKVVTFKTGGGVVSFRAGGGGVGQTPGSAGPATPYTPTYKRTKEPLAPDVKRAMGGRIKRGQGGDVDSDDTGPIRVSGQDIPKGQRDTLYPNRARGGKIESPKGVAPATRLPGGSGGGEARLTKERRAERDYKRA